MYEVSCASCSATFEYNLEDYIHLCPYCSSGFILDHDDGAKDLVGDHYIVSNRVDKDQIEAIFYQWLEKHYHRADRVKEEFKIIGLYGVSLPYWVVSLEAHTYWNGYSLKAKNYTGRPTDLLNKFVSEEGRFSRRYRWSILARNSSKEHWGLERLHNPREQVMVDWDGFPLDESMGVPYDSGEIPPIYQAKQSFKFDYANGLPVSGIQLKESAAISKAKDQVIEFHRRVSKTKVGTLNEHRTEVEMVGIQVIHVPFWILRYAFVPKSLFRFFTTARERRIVVQGYTGAVLEAEIPLNAADKVMTNLIVCGVLAIASVLLSVFVHGAFIFMFILFLIISILSAWRIVSRENVDTDIVKGKDLTEPA